MEKIRNKILWGSAKLIKEQFQNDSALFEASDIYRKLVEVELILQELNDTVTKSVYLELSFKSPNTSLI